MIGVMTRLAREEQGTEAAEWALMVVVLALAILFGGPTIQTALGGALGNVGTGVNSQVTAALP